MGGQGESDAVVPQEVERVIQAVADQLAGEIQRSLDFYAATSADNRISRVYLSGGSARIPALFKAIETRAAVPVEVLNPFKAIEVDNRRFDPVAHHPGRGRRGGGGGPRPPARGGQVAMIRINLLPPRVSRKKEAGKNQLILLALAVVAIVAGNAWWNHSRASELAVRQAKVKRTQAEIAQLERIIGEVKNIKAEQAAVKDKLAVLEKLKAGRRGPVGMLNELATIIPKRVWLKKMEEKGGTVVFEGTAGTIDDVSAFISALKDATYFSSPELKKTTARTEGKLKLVEFNLTATLDYTPSAKVAVAPAAVGKF